MQFKIFDLGLIDFIKAERIQNEIFSDVKAGYLESALILCQHYPVITMGRLGSKKNILLSEAELKAQRIPVYQIQRGGDVTYHGPGQLNAYPVFNLSRLKKDIHLFLRYLEKIIITLLADFGIKGLSYPGLTGVWINPVRNTASSDMRNNISNGVYKQKIASIGIGIRNWITFHGLSLNIKKDDLDNFHLIRPCGMDIEMTALENVLDQDLEIDKIKAEFILKFKEVTYGQSSPA